MQKYAMTNSKFMKVTYSSNLPFTGNIKKFLIFNHKEENGYSYRKYLKCKNIPRQILRYLYFFLKQCTKYRF